MKHLQGMSIVMFIIWGLSAMVACRAYGEDTYYQYWDQQRQIQKQQYELQEMQWQQRMDNERKAFDESERIYEQSEQDLQRREDHPEIYGTVDETDTF